MAIILQSQVQFYPTCVIPHFPNSFTLQAAIAEIFTFPATILLTETIASQMQTYLEIAKCCFGIHLFIYLFIVPSFPTCWLAVDLDLSSIHPSRLVGMDGSQKATKTLTPCRPAWNQDGTSRREVWLVSALTNSPGSVVSHLLASSHSFP